MQDFTGVPCVVDLATMREAMADLGGDPTKINPLAPAEMVIDHSVIADVFGTPEAFARNVEIEYERNRERYQFLRWGQGAFDDFKVVPPGTGIVHQVNIEHLARTVFTREVDGELQAYPDTCVGTDSHTTMVNGIGVVGWGVGGIEAEAAMLGQPVSMLIPRVVGFKLNGDLPEGSTATDLVLTITEMLRKHGVVGKFVEFYGPGVSALPLANRATIGNMSPEFGSTIAVFPIDEQTIEYLKLTGRPDEQLALVETYAKEQGLWHDPEAEPRYSERLELDLATVVPSLAGPKRPQDRVEVTDAKRQLPGRARGLRVRRQDDENGYDDEVEESFPASDPPSNGHGEADPVRYSAAATGRWPQERPGRRGALGRHEVHPRPRRGHDRRDHVVHQHLQPVGDDRRGPARQERRREGPPAQAVGQDHARPRLEGGLRLLREGRPDAVPRQARVQPGRLRLHHVHRQLRPAHPGGLAQAVNEKDLAVVSVLSGNRNFEGRINPDVKMNYLASPPLVVAYALAGSMDVDLFDDPLGQDADGNDVFLKDIWPAPTEVERVIGEAISSDMFTKDYADVFAGDEQWRSLPTPEGKTFEWDEDSTYVRKPPYFDGMPDEPEPVEDIDGARVLLKLGDSVTTDHISPAGAIKKDSPAGKYLAEHGVEQRDFNSYGSRRGNHEVMIRGTFANIRLRNQLAPGTEGGFTRDLLGDASDEQSVTTVFEASEKYLEAGRAAGRPVRQGVRLRLVARLGCEGHRAAGRQGRHRRVLRADPPVEPDRDGRAAAAVPRGRERRVARSDRRGGVLHHRRHRAQRRQDAEDGQGQGGRHRVRRRGPDRHPGRGELLPQRRHHAVRPAQPAQELSRACSVSAIPTLLAVALALVGRGHRAVAGGARPGPGRGAGHHAGRPAADARGDAVAGAASTRS